MNKVTSQAALPVAANSTGGQASARATSPAGHFSFRTARPRGPIDNLVTQRDCEADGYTNTAPLTECGKRGGGQSQTPPAKPSPRTERHPATNIGE